MFGMLRAEEAAAALSLSIPEQALWLKMTVILFIPRGFLGSVAL